MSKRKFSDISTSASPPPLNTESHAAASSPSPPPTNNPTPTKKPKLKPHQTPQQARLQNHLRSTQTALFRALKTARGFERQKLGRRQKDALKRAAASQDNNKENSQDDGVQGVSADGARLVGEVAALKNLDLNAAAAYHLARTLVRTKSIDADLLPVDVRQVGGGGSPFAAPAKANVTARLFNSNPVRTALKGFVEGAKRILGLEGPQKGAPHTGKSGLNGVKSGRHECSRGGKGEREEDVGDSESSKDLEGSEDGYGVYASRLADSSSGEGSDGAEEAVDYAGVPSNVSDTDSDHEPPPQAAQRVRPHSAAKPPSTASRAPVTSAFLPALGTGYISGDSDSDGVPDDIDQLPQRKNRKGQKARQAIWEKKYGARAHHMKKTKTKQLARDGRDAGWDLKRGATDEKGSGRKGKGARLVPRREDRGKQGKSDRPARGRGGDADTRGEKKRKASADKDRPLHPSWQAAKKAKEQKQGAAFAGKKIVFD